MTLYFIFNVYCNMWSIRVTRRISFVLVVLLTFSETIIHFIFIIPTFFRNSILGTILYFVLLCFIVVNLVGNYYFVSNIKTTAVPVEGYFHSMNDVRYCVKCKDYFPFTSRHCTWCNVCIFKPDHHCFIIGNCVGLANQRYFLILLIYSLAYSGIMVSLSYVLNIPAIDIVPMPKLFCNATIMKMWTIFHYLFLLCEAAIMLIQITILITSKTLSEKHMKYANCDHGFKKNIMTILGTRWYLVWMSPWIHSPLLNE